MDPLITLAIGIAIGGLAAMWINRSRPPQAARDAYRAVLKGPLPSTYPVHFDPPKAPTTLRSPVYPTNQEVEDWSRGDVVRLRSEPKIPTGGNAA